MANMNFVGIFFQLIIAEMLYNGGICMDSNIEYAVVLSSVKVWDKQTGDLYGTYQSVHLYKIEDSNSFHMYDENGLVLHQNIFQSQKFFSSQIEFISMYQLQLLFLFRRENTLVYFLCQFSDKEGLQTFVNSVNSMKLKDGSIQIHKMARYSTIIPETSTSTSGFVSHIVPFTNYAELGVRNILNSINVPMIVYYISHITSTGKAESDMIFVSRGFSLSAPSDDNVIALCVRNIPGVGFLLKFVDNENLEKFKNDYLNSEMQSDLPCDFPHAVMQQNPAYFND